MITSSLLEEIQGVRHGFFTRQGGQSGGIFASLNCGYGSGDDRDTVRANRATAMKQIGFEAKSLVTAYQTHSAKVATVTEGWDYENAPHVDALVTSKPGISLGILTADCTPVLLADFETKVIGAAHAGWRGAKSGVLAATIEAMVSLGAQVERMVVAIGPCIRQESYEVSDTFQATFLEDNPNNQDFFIPSSRQGHCQFDLPGYLVNQLERLSVSRIDMLPFDTYADEEKFFSFRRTTHRKEEQYGRLLSAIGLEPASITA